MGVMEFTTDEMQMLSGDGYVAGYIEDIREGDLVAIPPVMRTSAFGDPQGVKTLMVERVVPRDASYTDEDGGFVRHVVISFIGRDIDGLPRHQSYGNSYPCMFKRERSGAPTPPR